MINAMSGVAILMVIGALVLLVIFSTPWWLTALVISAVILLLDKRLNPISSPRKGSENADR